MILSKKNVKDFALCIYDNPSCNSSLEFEDDYKRIKYIKILLNRFVKNKKINLRLLLNHIICFLNVFPKDYGIKFLLLECDEELWVLLITIFLFLHKMPPIINLDDKTIYLSNYNIEWNFFERLKEL